MTIFFSHFPLYTTLIEDLLAVRLFWISRVGKN